MKTVVAGKNLGGRATKKTKDTIKRLYDGIRRGIPYVMCCELAGISEECFFKWRRQNPAFNAEVLRLTRESVFSLLDTLKEAHQQSWQSAAFMLERRWPKFYGRAEAQLNFLVQQNNIQNGNRTASSQQFEAMVLGDLEYSRLRQHPDYRHHAVEPGVIEVEAERVPEELSGHLAKQGHGGRVISESQQAQLERREQKAEAFIDSLLASRKASGAHHGDMGVQREPALESAGSVRLSSPPKASSPGASSSEAMLPSAIVLPAGEPTQTWWRQLASGDPTRLISKDAAIYAIRFILGYSVGETRARDLPLDFTDDLLTTGDILAALDAVAAGPVGRPI
jgi:hypothetical protein